MLQHVQLRQRRPIELGCTTPVSSLQQQAAGGSLRTKLKCISNPQHCVHSRAEQLSYRLLIPGVFGTTSTCRFASGCIGQLNIAYGIFILRSLYNYDGTLAQPT
ncbi:hypothetical protein HBI56_116030 [Parastagonospora nodorum]|uniref:Uncharacterized protein n=1 Tax=Phaeosphaeria nodorum (strain SN15 / ATCC MYA-4574 / FGSC 10173) TaxID=321614 RepID=A0A7U2F919_PHANO|nr:hypothetical protein HBH56_238560 [Parastagonospora nodorum]QRD00658.1 hypothetical protein JI435_092050 [Parastagonospora nodorum SN15]KAH3925878.1 hypothetical protein HBH54_177350 [Parastagonospora nodorum]KAH3976534.1 hypothetical protein HBH52_119920 [Parastagonospora nodorum]KAH4000382.1 hypothetical protein HBI10_101640 [Parastagonospora nodorum]